MPNKSPFDKLKQLQVKTHTTQKVKKAVAPKAQTVSDDQLFRQAMSGVRTKEQRAIIPKVFETPVKETKEDDTLVIRELENLVQNKNTFRLLDAESGIAFGVSYELLYQLKHGEFNPYRHLDLHGLHRDIAEQAVTNFIKQAHHEGERCVLIITGQGQKSPGGISVLREALPQWLAFSGLSHFILAFCQALPKDGGKGAFYVLLKR